MMDGGILFPIFLYCPGVGAAIHYEKEDEAWLGVAVIKTPWWQEGLRSPAMLPFIGGS